MPITTPATAEMFNANYDVLAEYVQDDSRIPYYNPSDSGVMISPGEPLLVRWGPITATTADDADLEARVYMAQSRIMPGEVGMLLKYFTGDFPCDVSANVTVGDEVYWDIDNDVVSLVGDVTNGFVLGDVGYATHIGVTPTVDGDDRVVSATTASEKIRVISRNEPADTKGTVVVY